jgi:uncharacterized protein (DUF433 family)
MDWREYIETNENILLGKPVIKGTRISVEHVIDILAAGWTEEQILENYPRLSKENLQAVFAYIQEILKDGLIYNKPAKSV